MLVRVPGVFVRVRPVLLLLDRLFAVFLSFYFAGEGCPDVAISGTSADCAPAFSKLVPSCEGSSWFCVSVALVRLCWGEGADMSPSFTNSPPKTISLESTGGHTRSFNVSRLMRKWAVSIHANSNMTIATVAAAAYMLFLSVMDFRLSVIAF